MRIALDARTLYRSHRRGTAKNLIDLYRRVLTFRPDWHVLAFHREHDDPLAPTGLESFRNFQPVCIEMLGDRLDAWEQFRFPIAAWHQNADLMHCPANSCPTRSMTPMIVTIHDLIPLEMPEHLSPAKRKRFEQSVRTACHKATAVLCPSQYTKDRLIEHFHARPDHVFVNPWAPDSAMHRVPAADCIPTLKRYNVWPGFVLHLGSGEDRKNSRRVLEAWATIGKADRKDRQLLIIGLDETAKQWLSHIAIALGVYDSVRLHGFADEADMPALLSAAEVLAYPSLSEGFGLPILDAWVAGAAVLTSDSTSLPEVAGGAALLVDPTDAQAIAAGLLRLLTDSSLRESLVAKGHDRQRQFNWDATAQRFIHAIEQSFQLRRPVRAAA